jgi:predicted RecB family nuclease
LQRQLEESLQRLAGELRSSEPPPLVSDRKKCVLCSWRGLCDGTAAAEGHLSEVSGIGGKRRDMLLDLGITSLSQLAGADPSALADSLAVHGEQHRTNFDIDPDKFFTDKVKREIPHDELHVMLHNPPSYLKMVEGINPVENKFFTEISEQERVDICFEEAFVIALERFNTERFEKRTAYCIAQQSLVTRIHPVWIADYVIENWNKAFWNASNSQHWNQYVTLRKK